MYVAAKARPGPFRAVLWQWGGHQGHFITTVSCSMVRRAGWHPVCLRGCFAAHKWRPANKSPEISPRFPLVLILFRYNTGPQMLRPGYSTDSRPKDESGKMVVTFNDDDED